MDTRSINRFIKCFFSTLQEVDPEFYLTIQQDADRIIRLSDERIDSHTGRDKSHKDLNEKH